jgi:Uma2 family endonuclease
MCATVAKPRLTADELEAMPDAKSYELVDGELVERAMGNEASWIGALITRYLVDHCVTNRLGLVFNSEAGYRCFADDPNRVRRPDVSFVRAGRLPGNRPPRGYAIIPPDLAVEVISPNDLASEVERKIDEYLAAGVRLIWVVNPDTRKVSIYKPDGSIRRLSEHDELDGDDVVPGFRCQIAAIFPQPDEPAPTPNTN